MTGARRYLVSGAFALATLVAGSGVVGCGGGGGASAPLPKAAAVDVTYYYLPG